MHYADAQQHQGARGSRAARQTALPEGEFLIELNPEVGDAVDNALALAQQGRTKQARETLTRLAKQHPRNHLVCWGMGTVAVIEEDFEQAIEWFDQAVAIFPYMIEAHFNKAQAHKELFDMPNYIRSLRKVVKFGDRNDADVMRARSLLDELEAGLRREKGIGLDTFLASSASFDRAFDHLQRGEWQQAADGFREVIAKDERSVASHGNLGLCYAYLGHKAQALKELERALELDPGYQPAKTNRRALLTMTEGQPLMLANVTLVEGNSGRPLQEGR